MLGWFSGIERTLDTIDLIPGKAQFRLWALLKGIVVIAGFLLVTSLIARWIERRVMKLEPSRRRASASRSSPGVPGRARRAGRPQRLGLDLTALNVLTGAIGIGLGFGLQSIAGNFVSGFVLLMDRSIKPGDVISFTGTTGTSTEGFGWVEELRGRYVVVRDRDGVETLVPNQNLITNPVINWSYTDPRVRLKLPVRVSYKDDPEVAMQCCSMRPRTIRASCGTRARWRGSWVSGTRHRARIALLDPRSAGTASTTCARTSTARSGGCSRSTASRSRCSSATCA